MDGKQCNERGYGKGVDISVPSGDNKDARAILLHEPRSELDKRKLLELEVPLKKAEEQLEEDKIKLKCHLYLLEQLKDDEAKLERSKKKKKRHKRRQLKRHKLRHSKQVKLLQNSTDYYKEQVKLRQKDVDNYEGGNPKSNDVWGDGGVSFGIPVVANIAAKMIMINPKLSAAEIVDMITTKGVDMTDDLKGLSKSGMINPIKCYNAAKDSLQNNL